MKLRIFVTLLFVAFLYQKAQSQSSYIIDNDSLLRYYLENNPKNTDTNSGALTILRNEKFQVGNPTYGNWYELYFSQERCYKILSKDALSLGEFAIPTSFGIKAKSINIYVCYLENGNLIKERITKSDALKETLVKGVKVFKFNIQELKTGRILYYSYTYKTGIHLSHFETIPITFTFQDKFPVIQASYELKLPSEISYKCIPQNIVFDSVSSPIGNQGNTVYKKNLSRSETSIWTAPNLEKIEPEPFVNDMDSKLASLKILVDSWIADTIEITKNVRKEFLYKSWKENLGKSIFRALLPENIVIAEHDTFKKITILSEIDSFRGKPFSVQDGDSLSLIKKVYSFVRDSIKTIYNDRGFGSIRNYKEIFKNKKANAIEKNALLTYLYQRMGLTSRNVILSTNEKINIDSYDPTIINYMVSVLTLGSQYYMLDPGYSFLPFGVLAPKCYNGLAFVMNEECLPIDISPKNYNDRINVSYILTPKDSSDDYEVKQEERYGKESGSTERAFIHRDTTENRNYFKDKVNELKYNITLLDWKILNEKYIDSQLIIKYKLDLKMENGNTFSYFNPFMKKIQYSNPLKDVNRKYPIEFEIGPNLNYQFRITMPTNIQIEEYPESKSIQFKDGALSYDQTITFDAAKNTLFVSYVLRSKQYEFPAEDYIEIRNFYEQIVSEQAKQIVFKKN